MVFTFLQIKDQPIIDKQSFTAHEAEWELVIIFFYDKSNFYFSSIMYYFFMIHEIVTGSLTPIINKYVLLIALISITKDSMDVLHFVITGSHGVFVNTRSTH